MLLQGMAADFVVLDYDPRNVPPVNIEKCEVLRTYFDGTLVWDHASE